MIFSQLAIVLPVRGQCTIFVYTVQIGAIAVTGRAHYNVKLHFLSSYYSRLAAPKLDIGRSPQHPFFGYLGPIRRNYAEKIHIVCLFF